jgi:hypothetical protein
MDVALRDWRVDHVDLVGSIFTGSIRSAMFDARVPVDDDRRLGGLTRNAILDNDFSAAELLNCSFRGGIDMRRNSLPRGAEYFLVPNALDRLARADRIVSTWESAMQRDAQILLNVWSEDAATGQETLLLRRADYYGAFPGETVDQVFSLLSDRPEQ